MPLYTFTLLKPDKMSFRFEFYNLATDGDAFARAGELLDHHIAWDAVEVWEADRPVAARHRFQPVMRRVEVGQATGA